jgi:hypothetical protein
MASLFDRSHAVHDDSHDADARTNDGRVDLASKTDPVVEPSDAPTGETRPTNSRPFRKTGHHLSKDAVSSPVLNTVEDSPVKNNADTVKIGRAGSSRPAAKIEDSDHTATDALNSLDDNDDDVYVPSLNRKWIILISIIVAAILASGVWLTQHERIQQAFENNVSDDTGLGSTSVTPVTKSDSIMDDLKIPKFYQKDNTTLTKDDKDDAQEYSLETLPSSSTGVLPSKESNPNLTSDPSKYLNSDGSINPNYSYLTDENTFAVMQDDLQRIINPVYGDWASLQNKDWLSLDGQHVDSSAWENLKNIFDSSVANEITDSASARRLLPLYADWDQNEYNGDFAGKDYNDAIVGVPIGSHCEYHIASSPNDHIDCTYKIRYTVNLNGNKKSVDKALTLHWKINYDDNTKGYTGRRVLLTSMEQQ